MGIRSMGVSVQWAFGCDVACTESTGFAEAVEAAKTADAVVMVIGLDQGQERCESWSHGVWFLSQALPQLN